MNKVTMLRNAVKHINAGLESLDVIVTNDHTRRHEAFTTELRLHLLRARQGIWDALRPKRRKRNSKK